jgi:hypothetical protein
VRLARQARCVRGEGIEFFAHPAGDSDNTRFAFDVRISDPDVTHDNLCQSAISTDFPDKNEHSLSSNGEGSQHDGHDNG